MAAAGGPDADVQICSIGRQNSSERTCRPAPADYRWMPANESRLLDAFMAAVSVGQLLWPERRCLRNEYFAPEQHKVIGLGPAHLLGAPSSWACTAATSGSSWTSARSLSKGANIGAEIARTAATSSSWHDKAFIAPFSLPGLYSTVKSYPNNLLTKVCCGIVDRR
jgi:hypothetical protein